MAAASETVQPRSQIDAKRFGINRKSPGVIFIGTTCCGSIVGAAARRRRLDGSTLIDALIRAYPCLARRPLAVRPDSIQAGHVAGGEIAERHPGAEREAGLIPNPVLGVHGV